MGTHATYVADVFANDAAEFLPRTIRPRPKTPHGVCSLVEGAEQFVEPFTINGDPDATVEWLKFVLASFPRIRLVEEGDDYLHFECTSLLFRFVDDLEFWVKRHTMTIHVRSAARGGRYDFGGNRQRVERIRLAFEEDY